MTRTSTEISSVPPTRKKRRSCSTRSRSTCSLGEMSPISSRKIVPPSASSNLPLLLRDGAGEGALLVAEQLRLEQRLGERRAGDGRRTACSARSPEKWMARATSSLPVPLSPWISTVLRRLATSRTRSKISRMRGFLLTRSWKRYWRGELPAQDRVLALEVLHLDDALDEQRDLLRVAGLDDVLLRALLHRRDRRVDGGVGGDDDDGGVGLELADLHHRLDAVDAARHLEVDEVDGVLALAAPSRSPRGRRRPCPPCSRPRAARRRATRASTSSSSTTRICQRRLHRRPPAFRRARAHLEAPFERAPRSAGRASAVLRSSSDDARSTATWGSAGPRQWTRPNVWPSSWTASLRARSSEERPVRGAARRTPAAGGRARRPPLGPSQLRLAVDEAQHRDEEVALGDAEQPLASAGRRAASSAFRISAELHWPRAGVVGRRRAPASGASRRDRAGRGCARERRLDGGRGPPRASTRAAPDAAGSRDGASRRRLAGCRPPALGRQGQRDREGGALPGRARAPRSRRRAPGRCRRRPRGRGRRPCPPPWS